jgi:hypothetical protein
MDCVLLLFHGANITLQLDEEWIYSDTGLVKWPGKLLGSLLGIVGIIILPAKRDCVCLLFI